MEGHVPVLLVKTEDVKKPEVRAVPKVVAPPLQMKMEPRVAQ
jgi:hypothetical protein